MHPIYPHGDFIAIAENLWQLEGTLKLPVPRNMTVVRTPGSQLVLYSAIALEEAGLRALEALGTPSFLVIPHRRHQLDAPFYVDRYPNLRVLAPGAAHVKRVPVHGPLRDLAPHDIQAYPLPSNTYQDVVMDVPAGAKKRALVICETLGNIRPPGGLASLLMRLLGPPGGSFGIARAVQLREIRKKHALHDWLLAQSQRTDLAALLFGHGAPLFDDIPGALQRAAGQL